MRSHRHAGPQERGKWTAAPPHGRCFRARVFADARKAMHRFPQRGANAVPKSSPGPEPTQGRNHRRDQSQCKPGISVGTRANAGPGMIVGTGAKHCFVRSGSAEPGTRAACATPAALLRDTGPRARTPHPHPVRGRVRTRPLARVALTGMGLAGAQEGLCRRGASRSSMPAHRLSTSRVRTSPCPARQTSMLAEPRGVALGLRRVQRGQLPWRRAARCRVWDFAALTRQESAMRCTPAPGRRCGRCCGRPRARARKARRAPRPLSGPRPRPGFRRRAGTQAPETLALTRSPASTAAPRPSSAPCRT